MLKNCDGRQLLYAPPKSGNSFIGNPPTMISEGEIASLKELHQAVPSSDWQIVWNHFNNKSIIYHLFPFPGRKRKR
jgi:hypothetical protein